MEKRIRDLDDDLHWLLVHKANTIHVNNVVQRFETGALSEEEAARLLFEALNQPPEGINF